MSEEVERLRVENEALRLELDSTRQERDDYAATVDEFIKDHKRWQERALTPEKRDAYGGSRSDHRPLGASEANRVLKALGVGKQSPQYKRVKAVLDQMMP